jgi:hypothetical protein
MLQVEITHDMKVRAYHKALEMGEIRNSITKGQGNIAGFLGEEIANAILDGTIENTKDYDLIHDGLRYDVKTKRCTSKPRPHYECSIAAYNTRQKCDRYLFVRVEWINDKVKRAWILGWMDKKEYFEQAHKLTKGEIDPSNNFVVKADCYNIAIKDLHEVHTITRSL